MSKFLKPTTFTSRALQNQWLNVIVGSHDLFCICDKPIDHLQDIINQQKCRHFKDTATTTTETATENGDDPITAGDLEELFKESDDTIG